MRNKKQLHIGLAERQAIIADSLSQSADALQALTRLSGRPIRKVVLQNPAGDEILLADALEMGRRELEKLQAAPRDTLDKMQ